ncbi:enoyl-CoA hydratase/isomerase family protein [Phenylobacterium sp.]|uniref:enoyl-CoA hydratase/isomerase family protein n=1 Tax=Phenylobacterium sp. TaxID=1871053 RepID=UPI002733E8CE|nr:enoyl-CoA hydratase/isomerase family protein [Phenylobacterium sp.]MDP3854723.1 enoyl-CoA hydratase/isomerase family protein [Phenylobacterium sp.]
MALVSVERKAGTAVITYANPPLGTMTAQGSVDILAAFETCVADDAVRVVVLTGGLPGIFIRHYDVGELSGLSDTINQPPQQPSGGPPPRAGGAFGAFVDLLASAPKPVIAAINGLCMGGGFEISLACDLRIAALDAAAIGLPETRAGIFPGGGGTQRLPRVIGEARALEMILLGKVVNGAKAAELGLVHEAVADPLARALEIAAELETRGADGLAYAKRLTRAALDRPLSEGLADERRSFVEILKTASAREGLRAARPPSAIQDL